MGAWGVGMQANDSSLDGLIDFEAAVRHEHILLNGGLEKWFLREFKLPNMLRRKETGRQWSYWGALGVADFMLDLGLKIKGKLKKNLHRAADHELEENRLSGWQSVRIRRAALLRFKDRLDGKEVDLKAVERDNAGLFSKYRMKLRARRRRPPKFKRMPRKSTSRKVKSGK